MFPSQFPIELALRPFPLRAKVRREGVGSARLVHAKWVPAIQSSLPSSYHKSLLNFAINLLLVVSESEKLIHFLVSFFITAVLVLNSVPAPF